MATYGGYTKDKIEDRASKRGVAFDVQFARDTRSSAQKVRDRTGRDRIEPKPAKDKTVKAAAPTGGKKKR